MFRGSPSVPPLWRRASPESQSRRDEHFDKTLRELLILLPFLSTLLLGPVQPFYCFPFCCPFAPNSVQERLTGKRSFSILPREADLTSGSAPPSPAPLYSLSPAARFTVSFLWSQTFFDFFPEALTFAAFETPCWPVGVSFFFPRSRFFGASRMMVSPAIESVRSPLVGLSSHLIAPTD